MQTTTLQVPMTKKLRQQAIRAAEKEGFSSLQEAVRVFLTKLATKKLTITFKPEPIVLSKKADKRYSKMLDEIESGKVKPLKAKSVEDLMKQLNS